MLSQIDEKQTTRKVYTSDLTDAQWELIASMIVLPEGGRPRTTNMLRLRSAIKNQSCNATMAKLGWTGSHFLLLSSDF